MATTSEHVNATGLTPQQSRALNERDPTPEEERIVTAIKEMYSCKPKESTYAIYAKDAVFEDPVGIAEGVDSIAAQFNILAKIFSHAELPEFHVLENPPNVPKPTRVETPDTVHAILIDQDVSYYRHADSSSPFKTVNSLITIHANSEYKVISHVEEWDHQHGANKDDGFFGLLNDYRKKITAGIVNRLVGKEPPKK